MLCGCKEVKQESSVIEQNINTCSTTIYFQPLDNFTQHEAIQLRAVLEQRFRDIFNEDFEFEILPNKKLTVDMMNDNKTRYRADKIIHSLSRKAVKHKITIGLE